MALYKLCKLYIVELDLNIAFISNLRQCINYSVKSLSMLRHFQNQ